MSSKSQKKATPDIRGVDLFCGAGGLTHGLEEAGVDMRLGVDIDPECAYPYAENNGASFLEQPVEDTTGTDLSQAFGDAPFRLIAGCAPCQPFSSYSQGWSSPRDKRWHLLKHFSRLVREARPNLVTMENVPRLERERVFTRFVGSLKDEGFKVSYHVVCCSDYGVPQRRARLVLLASKFGPISMIRPTTPGARRVSVRKAIGDLPVLAAGEVCAIDSMHQACELSPLNLRRIRVSKPGGTWHDWGGHLVARCHRKSTGRSYASVYGRMVWDKPSPTITTQYYGFGSGRFGHPEQDRAISLREGAILQSFPKAYRFFLEEGRPASRKTIGRLVGNAVPVSLGRAIGRSIVRHLEEVAEATSFA